MQVDQERKKISSSVWQSMVRRCQAMFSRAQYYATTLYKYRVSPATAYKRRRYYLSYFRPQPVPVHALSFLPDGFSIRKIADTGIVLIENFCTPEEADYLISSSRDRLAPRGVVVDRKHVLSSRRTSQTAVVFSDTLQDPKLLPILYRGAMLTGLPYNHVEAVYVTRYQEGQKFDAHTDFFSGFIGDRLYTILIYLNDLNADQGGETVFKHLHFAVRPKVGRAISWTNKNPDNSEHQETGHAALPVIGDAEKWVIQLWYRRYRMFDGLPLARQPVPQTITGKALSGNEHLPDGIAHFSDTLA